MPARRIGLIVNPIAGLGGSVALHGSDGVYEEALRRGATPQAGKRAVRALALLRRAMPDLEIVTYAGAMGAEPAAAAGFRPRIVGSAASTPSTASDTRHAAGRLAQSGVELLLFAGGDGTARDLFDAVGQRLPMLGIPAGVKMHSPVFATTPATAADVVASFLCDGSAEIGPAEILDIDEEARRGGVHSVRLHGTVLRPSKPGLVQHPKAQSSAGNEAGVVAAAAAAIASPGVTCLLGPGTTMLAIKRTLGVEGSLLGIDAVADGRLLGKDLSERDILTLIAERGAARLVISPIGGQGFLFGRGNQQLSATVLRRIGRHNILIVATQAKLVALDGSGLLVDTGDEDLDRHLGGWHRLMTGPDQFTMYRVAA